MRAGSTPRSAGSWPAAERPVPAALYNSGVQRYCRVAIDSPVRALDRPFDYEIPERMLGRVGVGSVVRVNLHGRNVRAFVVEVLDEPDVADPRVLSSLVSPEPLFSAETIALAAWTARRYVVPLGAVLHDAVPGRF